MNNTDKPTRSWKKEKILKYIQDHYRDIDHKPSDTKDRLLEMIRKKEQPSRGVLLVALGHPYFGCYAANLAMSLKFSAPDVKIALVHDVQSLSHLRESELRLFDQMIKCSDDWNMLHGIEQHIMSKLYLTEMSPWDETLFLDVDMIWHPKRSVEKCMNSLQDLDFTMQNRGCQDLSQNGIPEMASHWVNLNELKRAYNITKGTFWNLSSEFIWFKKTEAVKAMFKDAQVHYRTIQCAHTQFCGGIPDELCFALAMLKHVKVVPHRLSFTPVFWHQAEKNARSIEPREMYAGWYACSLGGSVTPPYVKKYYNNLAKHYATARGIEYPHQARDKRSFVDGRNQI